MMTMKLLALALTIFLVVVPAEAQKKEVAPNFSLKDAAGQTVELKKLRGKVVAVNFWATWCGPCRAEIPGLQKVYEKYKSKGFEIIGISLDEGGWEDVRPYIEKMKITYPVVIGNENLAEEYGNITAIPTTILVDREGNIVERHLGYLSAADFDRQIKALL